MQQLMCIFCIICPKQYAVKATTLGKNAKSFRLTYKIPCKIPYKMGERDNVKLSILVPHYKEEQEVIRPLLDSIAIQKNANLGNVEVVICHDGAEAPDFLFKKGEYPFEIRQIRLEKNCLGRARNFCLDTSVGDYVMFCDIDDMFFNVCALWLIFEKMKKGFDLLIPKFVEEVKKPETGEIVCIVHEYEATFIHGKVYRKSYLKEQNIRWDEELWVHEDYYFNVLAQSLTKDISYCQTPYYLWRWRDNSACRRDPKYLLKTYNNLIDVNEHLVDEFGRRGDEDDEQFYVVLMTFDAYYTMNKPEWIYQDNKEYRANTEKRFSDYFKAHKSLWDAVSDENKMAVSSKVRERNVREGMTMETIPIGEWLKHIEEI